MSRRIPALPKVKSISRSSLRICTPTTEFQHQNWSQPLARKISPIIPNQSVDSFIKRRLQLAVCGSETPVDQPESKEVKPQKLAARIAAEAVEVRAKTQALVLGCLKRAGHSMGDVQQAASAIFEGACQGVADVAEDQRAEVLTGVVNGMADGFAAGAQALKLSLQEAKGRGESFAADEITSALDDFKIIEELFVERVRDLASSGLVTASGEAGDLLQHAERAAASIHAELHQALQLAKADPLTLAKESASVAVGATRLAAGSLFKSMGKLLDSAGSKVAGESKTENPSAE